MGWAARAKQAQGNPEYISTSLRRPNAQKIHAHFRLSKQPIPLTFSDRTYLLDHRGVMRRAPAEAKP